MKKLLQSDMVALGLAIFSMLFGAGNLIYPLAVGMSSGTQNFFGMAGFILTAICLPLIGIFAMILYDGNYTAFFRRLGIRTGDIAILICMFVLGPLIAMPRIITLSHTLIAPFIPFGILTEQTLIAKFLFAIIFLAITFIMTYREGKIVDILGYVVSPLLLVSLSIIIGKGFFCAHEALVNTQAASTVFISNFMRGYETLDLLGAIFFSAIIISILTANQANKNKTRHQLALISLKGGLIGISLLGLIYIGMSWLGVFYGHGLQNINSGELFKHISLRVVGSGGAFVVATAVLMACLSTAIALSAVLSEYLQQTIFKNKISFKHALTLVLLSCIPLSTAGLGYVLKLTGGPLTFIGYPTLIVLTFANIAHKLWGIKMVKTPVLVTFVAMLVIYLLKF